MATLDLTKFYQGLARGGGVINSAGSGGNLPSSFVGPVRPGQTIGGVNPTAQRQVTGGGGTAGGGGGQVQGASTFASPQGVMQQAPQQPSIDFDALIAPALQSLDAYTPTVQGQYDTNVSDINAAKGTQLASNQANITGQTNTLEQARTGQTNLAENAANEARRQYSEIQQGLQSRYGGTTGTGGFATELAGRQTLQNIGKVRQGLSDAMLQIDNKLQQVQEIGRIAAVDIEDKAREQINQAKTNLDNQLASIRQQKGELQARKAELAANAMQLYQNQVNNVNAQNAAFKQNLYLSQLNAENQLKAAQQKAQGVAGSFDPNAYIQSQTQGTPVGGQTAQGAPQTAGGGALGSGDLYQKLKDQFLPQAQQLGGF